MNILVSVNKKTLVYTNVMLTSLFNNNSGQIDVYILYVEDQVDNFSIKLLRKQIVNHGGILHLIPINRIMLKDFFGAEKKDVDQEMLLLMVHLYLSEEIDRILYLKYDTIITGDISELYNCDIESNVLAAGGTHYDRISGIYCQVGASPKRGELFDTGVMLLNLAILRQILNNKRYSEIIEDFNNWEYINLEKIFNKLFCSNFVSLNPMIYNFRMDIYERYLRDGFSDKEFNPLILRYVVYDYYKMNVERNTRFVCIGRNVQKLLTFVKPYRNNYEMRPYWVKNDVIHKIWWYYAKKTVYYLNLRVGMLVRKILYIMVGLGLHHPINLAKNCIKYRTMFFEFKTITSNGRYLDDKRIKKYTYDELEFYVDSLPVEEAKRTMENLFTYNCERIKKRGKATVAFMVYSSSEWQCEKLYRKLEEDERYEPVIVLGKITQGTEETIERAYQDVCEKFGNSSLSYNVIYCYPKCGKNKISDSIYDDFDIFIYFRPGTDIIPEKCNFTKRKLTQLIVHIPYGFYILDKKSARYKNRFYDLIVFKMAWCYFCCDELQQKILKEQMRLGTYNVIFSGLPKLDILVEKGYPIGQKRLIKKNKKIRSIIWAPHWRLGENSGTFEKNYKWFLEYAKSHSDIFWIVRPHPRLPYGATKRYPVFKNLVEYDRYFEEWKKLPNVQVIPNGDYIRLFEASDAMILDSMSFLLEYQYTGKPLLMLLPDEPLEMNELGNLLYKVIYKAGGNDYGSIEKFISEVVISGEDYLKDRRELFFLKYLDYQSKNNKLASELIYYYFTKNIFKENK